MQSVHQPIQCQLPVSLPARPRCCHALLPCKPARSTSAKRALPLHAPAGCRSSLRSASQRRCDRMRTHGLVSPDIIAQPFVTANSVVCIPWLMMILAPNWEITKKVFRSEWSMVVPGVIFAFFFVSAAFIEVDTPIQLLEKVRFLFLDAIADPEKMRQILGSGPGYAAQDWIHLIAWDLIGGRWIYLDGLDRKVPTWHSLLITFGGGPLGLVLHFITRSIVKQKVLVE